MNISSRAGFGAAFGCVDGQTGERPRQRIRLSQVPCRSWMIDAQWVARKTNLHATTGETVRVILDQVIGQGRMPRGDERFPHRQRVSGRAAKALSHGRRNKTMRVAKQPMEIGQAQVAGPEMDA